MKLKRAAAIFFAGILLASEAVIPVFADTANTLYAPNNDGNSDVEEQGSVNVKDSRSAIGVQAEADSVFAIQFRTDQWCIVFRMKHISGAPVSDGYENSEVLLLTPEEAVERPDITNMSRAILRSYISDKDKTLEKGDYQSISLERGTYEIFGV